MRDENKRFLRRAGAEPRTVVCVCGGDRKRDAAGKGGGNRRTIEGQRTHAGLPGSRSSQHKM